MKPDLITKASNLKHFPVRLALVLVLVFTSLLAACSDKSASPVQPGSSTSRATLASDDGNEFIVLKDFVNAFNEQHLETALNLFNDEGVLVEFDEVAKESNFHQNGYYHRYTGKAEVKDWLKAEIASNSHLEPVEYKVSGIYLILDGTLYFQDQVMDFQLVDQSQNGRIDLLIYTIVKIKVS